MLCHQERALAQSAQSQIDNTPRCQFRIDTFVYFSILDGSAGHVGQRKPYLKTGVAGFRADFDRAPVLLHDSQGGIESESCTFADSLGGKESLKDVRLNVRGNSRTI